MFSQKEKSFGPIQPNDLAAPKKMAKTTSPRPSGPRRTQPASTRTSATRIKRSIMHSRFIRLTLCAWFSLLVVYFALASDPGPSPPSTWPPPVPTPTIPPVLPTPSPVNPEGSIPVMIEYGGGRQTNSVIRAGVMAPVGIPRAQSVTVTLFLPAAYAGQIMKIGLYDGGQVGAPAPPGGEIVAAQAFEVSTNGAIRFNFKADETLGLYRVLATMGADQYLLPFYAVTARPSSGSPVTTEVNPPIVTPSVDPLPTPTPSPLTTPQPRPF